MIELNKAQFERLLYNADESYYYKLLTLLNSNGYVFDGKKILEIKEKVLSNVETYNNL